MKWVTDVDLTRDVGWDCQVKPGDCHACYVYCQEKSLHSFLGFLELEKIFLASSSQPVHKVTKSRTRLSDGGHSHTSRKLLLFAVVVSQHLEIFKAFKPERIWSKG